MSRENNQSGKNRAGEQNSTNQTQKNPPNGKNNQFNSRHKKNSSEL